MTDRWILLSFLEKGSKITEDFGQNHKAKKVEPKAENPLFGVCVCVCVGDGGCWTVTNSILNLRKTITLSQRPVFGVKCDKLGVSPVAQW